jgi:hypothetical protein
MITQTSGYHDSCKQQDKDCKVTKMILAQEVDKSKFVCFRLVHSEHLYTIFKCTQCRFSTNTKSNLRSHVLTHKETVPLKCNLCEDYKCKRQSELRRHIRIKHRKSDLKVKLKIFFQFIILPFLYLKPFFWFIQTFSCEHCSYSTISRQHFKRHQNNVHKTQTRFCSHNLCKRWLSKI